MYSVDLSIECPIYILTYACIVCNNDIMMMSRELRAERV